MTDREEFKAFSVEIMRNTANLTTQMPFIRNKSINDNACKVYARGLSTIVLWHLTFDNDI